jgi:hypothetical protein
MSRAVLPFRPGSITLGMKHWNAPGRNPRRDAFPRAHRRQGICVPFRKYRRRRDKHDRRALDLRAGCGGGRRRQCLAERCLLRPNQVAADRRPTRGLAPCEACLRHRGSDPHPATRQGRGRPAVLYKGADPARRTLFAYAHRLARGSTVGGLRAFGRASGRKPVQPVYSSEPPVGAFPCLLKGARG